MAKLFIILSAISGALAVVLGAFGAHGLKGKIADNLLAAFQTGVQYQMTHALALFMLALLVIQLDTMSQALPKALALAGYFWLAGILLFSGSLYGLAMSGPNWLGPVTPLGGLCLIVGWLCLAVGAWQLRV